MQSILDTLQSVGIFLVFLVGRVLLLVLVVALLTVIFLAGLAVVRAFGGIRRRSLGLSRVDGLLWRHGLAYSPGHTWLDVRSPGSIRIGLDDLAQRLLSRVTAVKLPHPGATLRRGQPAVENLCGRRRTSIPSPIEGTVVAVNARVGRDPSLLHRAPYSRGWLFAIAATGDSRGGTVEGERARDWFHGETSRLSHFFERELGLAAADGGELVAPGPSLLTEEQWNAVTAAFLRPPAIEQPQAS
jgi:glycine cleavage system H protein